MNRARLALFCFALGFLQTGCCMKSITVKPEATLVAGKAVLGGEAKFEFDQCLTRKEQTQAERIKEGIADLWLKFADGKLGVEEYNAKVDGAHKALDKVVYRKKTGPGHGTGTGYEELNVSELKQAADDLAKANARAESSR